MIHRIQLLLRTDTKTIAALQKRLADERQQTFAAVGSELKLLRPRIAATLLAACGWLGRVTSAEPQLWRVDLQSVVGPTLNFPYEAINHAHESATALRGRPCEHKGLGR